MKIGQEEIHPKELQKLLEQAEGDAGGKSDRAAYFKKHEAGALYHPLRRAFRTGEPVLLHFTSPIRRYPDLQIHRIIKEQLSGRLDEERTAHYESILEDVAKQTSRTERRADEADGRFGS